MATSKTLKTESTPEENLSGVMEMDAPFESVAGNQTPVTVTGVNLNPENVIVRTTQALVGIDGGDGTRASRATKVADDAWRPFYPPAWFQPTTFIPKYWWINGSWQTAGATTIYNTTNDTADVAGNSLTKF
jgi:hypothetical protein